MSRIFLGDFFFPYRPFFSERQFRKLGHYALDLSLWPGVSQHKCQVRFQLAKRKKQFANALRSHRFEFTVEQIFHHAAEFLIRVSGANSGYPGYPWISHRKPCCR